MNRLGFTLQYHPDYIGTMLPEGATSRNLIFRSDNIKGNNKHFDNAIGHSRTYTTKENPDILHVMESLSDWALEGNRVANNIKADIDFINEYKDDPGFMLYIDEYGELTASPREYRLSSEEKIISPDDFLSELYSKLKLASTEQGIKLHMLKTYTTRQIQENLKYAAENGLTKMRYPTPESAAKIEGFSKLRVWNPDYDKKYEEWKINYKKINGELFDLFKSVATKEEMDLFYRLTDGPQLDNLVNIVSKRNPKIQELYNARLNLEEWIAKTPTYIETYPSLHQSILKKYADFPKQYEKLFGKGTVRTVTDDKGNTWYEVDVPRRYINGTAEMLFRSGGNLIPKRRIRR